MQDTDQPDPISFQWYNSVTVFVIELTYKAGLEAIDAHMAPHVRFLHMSSRDVLPNISACPADRRTTQNDNRTVEIRDRACMPPL